VVVPGWCGMQAKGLSQGLPTLLSTPFPPYAIGSLVITCDVQGKLRMLYECYPMAMLMEKAGGRAIDGKT
jgi:hypothetical protein